MPGKVKLPKFVERIACRFARLVEKRDLQNAIRGQVRLWARELEEAFQEEQKLYKDREDYFEKHAWLYSQRPYPPVLHRIVQRRNQKTPRKRLFPGVS